MGISQEVIEILTYLLPGFIFMSIVRLRCATKDLEYQYYIIYSLIVSLFIYYTATAFGVAVDPTNPMSFIIVLFIAVATGIIWSVVINDDLLSKVFHLFGSSSLSSQDYIYPVKGIKHFTGKWHVVRLKQVTEILGFVKEFDVQSHEMLIEDGRLVLPDGELSPESAWYYIPAGQRIASLRTIEGGYDEQ